MRWNKSNFIKRNVLDILSNNSPLAYNDLFLTPQKDVMSPKCTKHSCTLTWSNSGGQDEIKTVELAIETTPANIDWKPKDKSSQGEYIIFITLL